MANNRRDKGQHAGQGEKPAAEHHCSTAHETAALNETFKSFAKDYYKDEGAKARRERIKFRIEIGLAIGVAANIALTVGLLIAGAVQADYSGQQVKASQAQLDVMRDTETRQLRAYVGITQRGIENFGEDNQVLRTLRKNYGQTPAIDLFMSFPNIAMAQANTQFNPALCYPAPQAQNTFALFPGQELSYKVQGKTLPPDQIDLIRKNPNFVMLFWGVLHYKDVFGIQHCTRYCWAFKGSDMTESANDICLQHNDSY